MTTWEKSLKALNAYLLPTPFANESNTTKVKLYVINLIIPLATVLGFLLMNVQGELMFTTKNPFLVYLDFGYLSLLAILFIWFRFDLNLKNFSVSFSIFTSFYFVIQVAFSPKGYDLTPWLYTVAMFLFIINSYKKGIIQFGIFAIGVLAASVYRSVTNLATIDELIDNIYLSYLLFAIMIIINEFFKNQLMTKLEGYQAHLIEKNITLTKTNRKLRRAQTSLSQERNEHQIASNTLSTTINNTNDLIWVFTPQGQFKIFNNAFKQRVTESFGITEFSPDLFTELTKTPDGKALVDIWMNRIKYSIRSKEPSTFFDKFLTQNKLLYFVTEVSPILENGEITSISCFSKDITSLKLVEKENEDLTNVNHSILQSLDEIIFEYNIKSDVFTWNEAVMHTLDISYQELGTNKVAFIDRMHENDQVNFSQKFDHLTNHLDKLNEEVYLKAKDRYMWFQLKATSIAGKNNIPNKIIGILSCIEAEKSKDAQKMQAVMTGIDQERKRIAGEIHDSLGQTLIAASLSLNTLSHKIKASLNESDYQQYHTIENMINDAIQEGRDISHNLMPKSLEDYGLIASIRTLINKINSTDAIGIEFYSNIDISTRFDQTIEINIYRVIQEGLNNVLKHSKAEKVTMQLLSYDDNLSLTIEDNGQGFTLDGTEEGIGLQNIQNRINAISGTINIDSHKDYGTLLTIDVAIKKG